MTMLGSDSKAYERNGGFWEPHTSSIDFCEKNYVVTPYLAEFHNTWSSIPIAFVGLFGYLYANPTNEFRYSIMYIVFFVIGLGSVLLHATLMKFPQSFDEIPMLWANLTFLFALIDNGSTKGESTKVVKNLDKYFFIVAIIQTVLYYSYQSFYAVFLATYISIVVVITLWTLKIAYSTNHEITRAMRIMLWKIIVAAYILFGSVLWILDMNICDQLQRHIYSNLPTFGMTFHVFWHFGAAYGTYVLMVFLTLIRMESLKRKPILLWTIYYLPYIEDGGSID